MGATIGDGITVLALTAGIVCYLYLKHQRQQKKIEIIHQERILAMEKGIPLPEFPLEPLPREPDPRVLPILGTVLLTFSIGVMIMLFLILEAPYHSLWVSPLPVAFLGLGLVGFHFLKSEPRR